MDAMEIYSVNQWFISFAASLLYQYNVTYQIRHKLHTHPFNGPFSETARLGRYQKGKTSLDFTEARDSEWQWHQLGHMQVCTSLQTDNHASTSPIKFFTCLMPFLSLNQLRQSIEGIRHKLNYCKQCRSIAKTGSMSCSLPTLRR